MWRSLLGFLLIATIESANKERYDNLDLTGNLSQWVQYGELTQEEKKLTLEYLTTDTGAEWEREAELMMTTTENENEETTTTELHYEDTTTKGFQEELETTEFRNEETTTIITVKKEQSLTEFQIDETRNEPSFHFGNQSQIGARIIPTSAPAALGDYPYFALVTATTDRTIVNDLSGYIEVTVTITCGGAIISEAWVLTAAQCVATALEIRVDAGLTSAPTAQSVPLATSRGVATIHPGFIRNFLIHDIALIRLLSPFKLSANVAPIQLVKKDYHGSELNSVTVRTMGFGLGANTGSPPSSVFNYVDLIHMSKTKCKSVLKTIFIQYPSTLSCLTSSTSTQGFCLGDIGGPVVYRFASDQRLSLLGITSNFQSCPSAYPSGYTRIGPYYKWIKSKEPQIITRK